MPVVHDPAADGGSEASGQAKLTIREGDVLTTKLGATRPRPRCKSCKSTALIRPPTRCPAPTGATDLVDDALIETEGA